MCVCVYVYVQVGEKDDPRFHGGKKGVCKQGRRVGGFGILAGGKLTVAWFDGGKCTGPKFAASAPWGCEPLGAAGSDKTLLKAGQRACVLWLTLQAARGVGGCEPL